MIKIIEDVTKIVIISGVKIIMEIIYVPNIMDSRTVLLRRIITSFINSEIYAESDFSSFIEHIFLMRIINTFATKEMSIKYKFIL